MRSKEVRSSDKGIINEKVIELKKELVKINAQIAIGAALSNPGQARKIKKTIAKILTIEHEKEKKSKNPSRKSNRRLRKKNG